MVEVGCLRKKETRAVFPLGFEGGSSVIKEHVMSFRLMDKAKAAG